MKVKARKPRQKKPTQGLPTAADAPAESQSTNRVHFSAFAADIQAGGRSSVVEITGYDLEHAAEV
jgi:hypothetical protein